MNPARRRGLWLRWRANSTPGFRAKLLGDYLERGLLCVRS
jgi:hypothetical protein